MTRTLPLLGLAALGFASAAGCAEDFDPYNRLTALRVLAIASDPPNPGPGETATLRPLLHVPNGETPTFAWSWCPVSGNANEGYRCPFTPEQLGMLAGPGAPPISLDLGTEPTARLPHVVPPEVLQAICSGRFGGMTLPAEPDCKVGYPILVKMEVKTPTDTVVAVRTVNLRFGEIAANANPTIDGLRAVIGEAEVPIDGQALATLPRDKETVIKALVPPTAAEPLPGRPDQGNRERVFLTWFVESGDTRDERTSFIEGLDIPFERPLSNRWEPARKKDYPRDTSRLVVVIRDDRGGVAWTDGVVKLEAQP
jgi:hypothetical protein